MRTSVVIDDALIEEARALNINVSAAARDGLRRAVQRARAEEDRAAYEAQPESDEDDWADVRAWGRP